MLKRLTTILIVLTALSACSEKENIALEFRIAEEESAPNLTEMVFEPTGKIFYLHDKVLIDQSDIESAVVTIQNGHPAVELILTSKGTKKFEVLTAQNVGKRCGMVVDGKLLSAPIIRDTISGGRAIISGIFTESEAETITNSLNKK